MLASQAVAVLSTSVRRPLRLHQSETSFGAGFSVEVESEDRDASVLDLRLRGIVGASIHDDRLLIRAWLFLYSGELRIGPPTGEVFLELELVPEDGGTWRGRWARDVHGEFDAFDSFSGAITP